MVVATSLQPRRRRRPRPRREGAFGLGAAAACCCLLLVLARGAGASSSSWPWWSSTAASSLLPGSEVRNRYSERPIEAGPLTATLQTPPQLSTSPLLRQLADGAPAAPAPGAAAGAAAPDEAPSYADEDGDTALGRVLNGDGRLEALEACLPSSRRTGPGTMARAQELVEDNGGTVLALAGPDYCVLAADTRLSSDYRIRTRNVTRLFEVRACAPGLGLRG